MRPFLPCTAALLLSAAPALAQVEVTSLAPPDLFSTPAGGDPTGLGDDLWRGTSPDILRAGLAAVAAKPLSPAAKRLAHRVLATGAAGPQGAGNDPALGAARARGLLALGDAAGAATVLERAPNLSASSDLSQAAAESALTAGQDERACAVADQLTQGRGEAYWLRLRAYCQAVAGQNAAAQLTLNLAPPPGKADAYPRLMTALLNPGAAPGAASAKTGVEYALSRRLKLDLAPAAAAAGAAPAIAAQLAPPPAPDGDLSAGHEAALNALTKAKGMADFTTAAERVWPILSPYVRAGGPLQNPALVIRAAVAVGDVEAARMVRGAMTGDAAAPADDLALLDALIAAAAGQADGPTIDRLIERGAKGGVKSAAQPAALILASLAESPVMSPAARAELAGFEGVRSAASPARLAALDFASASGFKGETAMLAAQIAADAGVNTLASADRARIVRALLRAGLTADARAFAAEGILALQVK